MCLRYLAPLFPFLRTMALTEVPPEYSAAAVRLATGKLPFTSWNIPKSKAV